MSNMPGVMIYLELKRSLELFTDEEKGKLLDAILNYAETGELPQFSERGMKTLWNSVREKIDRDAQKYEETRGKRRQNRLYGIYKNICIRRGDDPVSFEEWKLQDEYDSQYDADSTNDDK